VIVGSLAGCVDPYTTNPSKSAVNEAKTSFISHRPSFWERVSKIRMSGADRCDGGAIRPQTVNQLDLDEQHSGAGFVVWLGFRLLERASEAVGDPKRAAC
jgi:hypothetical protein